MSKANNPIIVADFETGGLDCRKHAITEVALVCLSGDTLQEIGRYESYVKPYGMEYDQEALDYTGITLEKLEAEGKPLDIVMHEMTDKIDHWREKDGTKSNHRKKPIVTGQNILFDIGFFQQIFKLTKRDISKYFDCEKDYFGNYTMNFLDTLNFAKLIWGNDETMTSYKLGLICAKLGIEIVDAHKAINDVEGTANVLAIIVSRLRSGEIGNNQSKIRLRNHFQFS